MAKNWCVYDLRGVGYIEKEYDDGTLLIRYSEQQMFPLQFWNPIYVERFETWQEAFKLFRKFVILRHYNKAEDYIFDSFPTYAKHQA